MKSTVALREEETLKFWKDRNIFEKSLQKDSPKGEFVFYDGPPFATGLPHFGHVLPGTMKDVIPRYKTMQGYRVMRRWGWDCHGLPIENLIEKELGLKSKKDIETFGIERFNAAARARVFRYRDEWKRIIPRLGRFVDMENDYRTLDPSYTESVWWSWKTLFEKKLAYEDFKIMPFCPHCGTTLSNFEVSQGYKDITDISAYVKFELEDEPGTYLLAWTTTPWTLPGNFAIAVNPKIQYEKLGLDDGSKIIFAFDRFASIPGLEKYRDKITHSGVKDDNALFMTGKDLVGKRYKPVFTDWQEKLESSQNVDWIKKKQINNCWKIYPAEFVANDNGTGIVHIAPAYGEDDMKLAKEFDLPVLHHVGEDGTFNQHSPKEFIGHKVKPIEDHQSGDVLVIKYLAAHGSLFAKEKIIHSYPHCWRCETPLLNFATSSWFVKVTALKEKLIKGNKKVTWIPEEIGSGRFGKWLEGARDWAVSRSRYWGAPLPIWKSEDGKEVECLGSLDELKKKTSRGNTFFLLRHGQAENNEKNILSSKFDNPHHLSALGKEQIQKAGTMLKKKKIDAIYSSDFIRTKETAEIVADAIGYPKDKIVYDPRLREINVGDFEGKNISEYHKAFPGYKDSFDKPIPGGENNNDVRKRMGDFLYEIDGASEGKNILVISHETPLWMLASAAEGFSSQEIVAGRSEGIEYIKNGEVRELAFAQIPHNANYELDFHRPYIDKIEWKSKSGGIMKRIPDIFDTWYDSGSMPYAQNHYPFSNKKEFEKKGGQLFPADFIAEGLDQTRGWFYTLLVLSIALFDKVPYKNIVVNGLILAEDGRKMSKSLKNYPDLEQTINRYGADALRYFLMSSPATKAEDVRFSEKSLDEVVKKNMQRLDNVHSFYELYKDETLSESNNSYLRSTCILDRWILSRLNEIQQTVTTHLDLYEFDKAARPIESFIDDLSTWYIRRSRDRFKSEDAEVRRSALSTTRLVLNTFSKIIAPFMPFIAEELYQKTKAVDGKESVHLESWPKSETLSKESVAMLANMEKTRDMVSIALEARTKAAIKVRQPLASLSIKEALLGDYLELIKDEVNVKTIVVDPKQDSDVILDTAISADLKAEGDMRELLRAIQEARKTANLMPKDTAIGYIPNKPEYQEIVNKFRKLLLSSATLQDIVFEERGDIEVRK